MRPDKVPYRNLYVVRGAPDALPLRERDVTTDEFTSFANPVTLRITLDSGTIINLAEGAGITVDASETPDTPRGTITVQITVPQSRQIPLGNFASYELQEAAYGNERLISMGRVIGIAGNNADV